MITLNDLECFDGLYYIGNLIDADGKDWVEKEEAEEILKVINL